MTVRIIKPGDKTRLDPVYQFRCFDCGCEFEANRSDTRTDPHDAGSVLYISCPTCKRECWFNLIGSDMRR